MKQLHAYRKPDVWKNLLSFIIALTFMLVWLPFIRSIFDGTTYQWGAEFFGTIMVGKGLEGDFYYLVLQMAFFAVLFVSMYWVKNRRVFYGMLIAWFVLVFVNLWVDMLINGPAMFHGDTMDVHISITWIVIPVSILALALIVFVIRNDVKTEETQIAWTDTNRRIGWGLLLCLPIQLFLLSTGEPHELTDEIGVIISIAQCYVLPFLLKPYKKGTDVSFSAS